LSPNDPNVLTDYGAFKRRIGNFEEALRFAERRSELDPTGGRTSLVRALIITGEVERGIAIYREVLASNPRNTAANRTLANYEAENGNFAEAKAHLDIVERADMRSNNLTRIAGLANHYAQYGFKEDAARVLEEFEEKAADRRVTAVARVWEHLARGDEEQALYWLERVAEQQERYQGFEQINSLKENSFNYPILDKPEFVEVRERLGFTDL